MSYTIEKIEADKVLEIIADYQYALVYKISEITFCMAAELKEFSWEECIEARFFDETKELHIYEEDGELCAVKTVGELDDDCLVKKYNLQEHYFGENKCLCVCEHLDYDNDGQAFIVLTRLTGIE